MKSFKTLLAIATAMTLTMAGGNAAAQAKAHKTEAKQKSEIFNGTIICTLVDNQEAMAMQQKKGEHKNAGQVVRVQVAQKEASQENERREEKMTLSYGEKVAQSSVLGVSCLMPKADMLVVCASQKEANYAMKAPVCKASPSFCKLAETYMEVLRGKDKEAADNFQETFYKRTGETREIAGVKATGYEMYTEIQPVLIWVDESKTCSGLCWPFIGMTHPVLAGTFFMPTTAGIKTPLAFEAVKILEEPADIETNFKEGKDVDTEQMEQIISNLMLKGGRQ